MQEDEAAFKAWLSAHHPHVTLLLNEEITIQGVNFLGGTMWTNFANSNPVSMDTHQRESGTLENWLPDAG
jgi:hypothetical protein